MSNNTASNNGPTNGSVNNRPLNDRPINRGLISDMADEIVSMYGNINDLYTHVTNLNRNWIDTSGQINELRAYSRSAPPFQQQAIQPQAMQPQPVRQVAYQQHVHQPQLNQLLVTHAYCRDCSHGNATREAERCACEECLKFLATCRCLECYFALLATCRSCRHATIDYRLRFNEMPPGLFLPNRPNERIGAPPRYDVPDGSLCALHNGRHFHYFTRAPSQVPGAVPQGQQPAYAQPQVAAGARQQMTPSAVPQGQVPYTQAQVQAMQQTVPGTVPQGQVQYAQAQVAAGARQQMMPGTVPQAQAPVTQQTNPAVRQAQAPARQQTTSAVTPQGQASVRQRPILPAVSQAQASARPQTTPAAAPQAQAPQVPVSVAAEARERTTPAPSVTGQQSQNTQSPASQTTDSNGSNESSGTPFESANGSPPHPIQSGEFTFTRPLTRPAPAAQQASGFSERISTPIFTGPGVFSNAGSNASQGSERFGSSAPGGQQRSGQQQ